MGRTLVVPDLHGRFKLARDFLAFAEVLDPDDNYARIQRPDEVVVQIGDLANCVGDDRVGDLALLRKTGWFDVRLVGNHEYPYFRGATFRGFQHLLEVERAIRNVTWVAAHAIGNTILTHAGISSKLVSTETTPSAKELAVLLNAEWKNKPESPLFAMIGPYRGGYDDGGGILWRDDVVEDTDVRWNQVYGHTMRSDGPHKQHHADGTWAINLDCGGHGPDANRIVGVWLDDDGEVGETIDYTIGTVRTPARLGALESYEP